jgi:glycogen synthase
LEKIIRILYFLLAKINASQLNYFYNLADAQILLTSNEGWGLSLTEAMLAGTPIIANVTGGMQDQMRFEDENGNWINQMQIFRQITRVNIKNVVNGHFQCFQVIVQFKVHLLHLIFGMIDVILKMLLNKL